MEMFRISFEFADRRMSEIRFNRLDYHEDHIAYSVHQTLRHFLVLHTRVDRLLPKFKNEKFAKCRKYVNICTQYFDKTSKNTQNVGLFAH